MKLELGENLILRGDFEPQQNHSHMERVMGIEPTSTPWKGVILPVNYTRDYLDR